MSVDEKGNDNFLKLMYERLQEDTYCNVRGLCDGCPYNKVTQCNRKSRLYYFKKVVAQVLEEVDETH